MKDNIIKKGENSKLSIDINGCLGSLTKPHLKQVDVYYSFQVGYDVGDLDIKEELKKLLPAEEISFITLAKG